MMKQLCSHDILSARVVDRILQIKAAKSEVYYSSILQTVYNVQIWIRNGLDMVPDYVTWTRVKVQKRL